MRDDESRVMTFACGRHGPLHALVRFMVPSLRSLIPLAGRRSVVDHSKVRCFTIVRTLSDSKYGELLPFRRDMGNDTYPTGSDLLRTMDLSQEE